MELYYVLAVVDRSREERMVQLMEEHQRTFILTAMGTGTATTELLNLHGLEPTDKAIVMTVAGAQERKDIFRDAKRRLLMDIPGNGILLAIPIKSVGGGKTLAYISNNETPQRGTPDLRFTHEMILVVLNQGFTDVVMDAARAAGAQGGTVVHAKGTGTEYARRFLGVSIASEREIIMIVASAQAKGDIMRAIREQAGPETPSGAICFSLPVSAVAGLRQLDAEEG